MAMGGKRLLVVVFVVAISATGCVPPPGGTSKKTGPVIRDCPVFPADNAWNTPVDTLPVRKNSATWVANISSGSKTKLHPDFGGKGKYGIPFTVVGKNEPKRTIKYTAYGSESDPGPFPIPPNAPIEGGSASDGDRHVIVFQEGTCRLYELYRAYWRGNRWDADSGVNWNLKSNAKRPLGWTSADAAGLPILPGLVRYGETQKGEIKHAIRFTAPRTQRGYIFPATHFASSSNDPNLPPMGARLRLKKSFDISGFHDNARVILKAMKKYGIILADNGSSWYFQGAADPRWDDNDLGQLKRVPGSAFEVVDTGPVRR